MSEENKVPGSSYLKNRGQKAQQSQGSTFESAINEYKTFLKDQTHPDNQTEAYQNNLKHALNQLLVKANDRDEEVPGEGIFGLIVLALRSVLLIKDEITKNRAEMKLLRIEIKRLQKQKQ